MLPNIYKNKVQVAASKIRVSAVSILIVICDSEPVAPIWSHSVTAD